MKIKIIKLFLLLLVISLLSVSCQSGRNCGGMKHHNNDVKRGLAH
ncbi:MAG TPA: hypothetical protein PLT47_08905 [Bacteroidales bacterium]|nr:hypothetical protein [Bacteroidales bacterium]HQI70855.1 hypothetical protein [Bacteroidales bacterium]